jgi:hypothetical protein
MKSMGFMYLAKRPCGRVSAMSWDDPGHKKSISQSIAAWLARGDIVERVERFEGDSLPQQICSPDCTDCRIKTQENPR